MSRSIWRFPLVVNTMSASFTTVIRIPEEARLVYIRDYEQHISMWFEVDPEAKMIPRYFQLFPTGAINIRQGLEYVGTCLLPDVGILHVYEVMDRNEGV